MNLPVFKPRDVYSFPTPEMAALELSKLLVQKTTELIEKNGKCTWAFSGGSSVLKIYDALLLHEIKINMMAKNLTVFWVDERNVPHTHESSNYGVAYDYFWKKISNVNLVPVPYSELVEKSAEKYDQVLRENGIKNGEIDFTILGMGTDGHTASLFPNEDSLNAKNEMITHSNPPTTEHARVSMTFDFINSSNSIFLYFYGKEKADTFQRAKEQGDLKQYPILNVNGETLTVFTDENL